MRAASFKRLLGGERFGAALLATLEGRLGPMRRAFGF